MTTATVSATFRSGLRDESSAMASSMGKPANRWRTAGSPTRSPQRAATTSEQSFYDSPGRRQQRSTRKAKNPWVSNTSLAPQSPPRQRVASPPTRQSALHHPLVSPLASVEESPTVVLNLSVASEDGSARSNGWPTAARGAMDHQRSGQRIRTISPPASQRSPSTSKSPARGGNTPRMTGDLSKRSVSSSVVVEAPTADLMSVPGTYHTQLILGEEVDRLRARLDEAKSFIEDLRDKLRHRDSEVNKWLSVAEEAEKREAALREQLQQSKQSVRVPELEQAKVVSQPKQPSESPARSSYVAVLEEERAHLTEESVILRKERDELRQQLQSRKVETSNDDGGAKNGAMAAALEALAAEVKALRSERDELSRERQRSQAPAERSPSAPDHNNYQNESLFSYRSRDATPQGNTLPQHAAGVGDGLQEVVQTQLNAALTSFLQQQQRMLQQQQTSAAAPIQFDAASPPPKREVSVPVTVSPTSAGDPSPSRRLPSSSPPPPPPDNPPPMSAVVAQPAAPAEAAAVPPAPAPAPSAAPQRSVESSAHLGSRRSTPEQPRGAPTAGQPVPPPGPAPFVSMPVAGSVMDDASSVDLDRLPVVASEWYEREDDSDNGGGFAPQPAAASEGDAFYPDGTPGKAERVAEIPAAGHANDGLPQQRQGSGRRRRHRHRHRHSNAEEIEYADKTLSSESEEEDREAVEEGPAGRDAAVARPTTSPTTENPPAPPTVTNPEPLPPSAPPPQHALAAPGLMTPPPSTPQRLSSPSHHHGSVRFAIPRTSSAPAGHVSRGPADSTHAVRESPVVHHAASAGPQPSRSSPHTPSAVETARGASNGEPTQPPTAPPPQFTPIPARSPSRREEPPPAPTAVPNRSGSPGRGAAITAMSSDRRPLSRSTTAPGLYGMRDDASRTEPVDPLAATTSRVEENRGLGSRGADGAPTSIRGLGGGRRERQPRF